MKITIDSQVCEANQLSVEEVLCVLLLRQDNNLSELIQSMLEKQVLVPDVAHNGRYLVTQRWNAVVDSILLAKDKEIPDLKQIDKLAVKMAALFPLGRKDGTQVYWKGNKKDTILKLQKFFKLYGNYSADQILEATKNYVDSFNGNYQTMRVLKYFILKDNESDLATQLENLGQEELKNDWNVMMK